MVEKRPHPDDGRVPTGDAKRAKPSDAIAAARAKAAEIAARFAGSKPGGATNGASTLAAPATSSATTASASAARLEALKARVAALKGSHEVKPASPPPDSTGPRFPTTAGNRRPEGPKVEAKPKKSAPKPVKEQDEELENPYFDPKTAGQVKGRVPRAIVFNEHGKYLDQASKLRAQSRLEQIKKMLALQARRAGLDENSERGFLIQQPPDVEWWDEGLLGPDKVYASLDEPNGAKIDSEDSIITIYVQHPPLVKAPQDQRLVEVKPMYLTTKETQKLRRMRRAADLKEQQAKVRLGLEPSAPAKIKRGNMMRVMGEQAIADPTAVEMLVESQIQQRHDDHVTKNEERKLTKEQQLAKLAANQEKDAQKGLYICVFKINTLAFGKHRYQIDNNAKQLALTGVTIFNPDLNLVIVEGGLHSISKFKKLMLHRIKWDQNAPPTDTQAEKQASEPQWMRSMDDTGNLKDHSYNKCILLFEGEIKQHSFRKWGSKMCETAGEARELLARSKLDSLWALAKSIE
jgi:U4/U6 small nuclear ribonucleoprotein PRP3